MESGVNGRLIFIAIPSVMFAFYLSMHVMLFFLIIKRDS